LIDNPNITIAEMNEILPGPDFPTGGVIMGRSGIRAAYSTGRGRLVVRGRTEIEEIKNNKFQIVITEIPYMVNKRMLVKSMVELADSKKIEGIDDIVDYSNREGMKIVVELKKDVNPQVVLNQLYSYTQLQSTFGVIMLALVDGVPKILSLKEMLSCYVNYQKEIVSRRTAYLLKKAQEKAHIIEGLKIALDFIDEVIKIIRASATIADAKAALIERFPLDEIQAGKIVEMRLGQLTGLERSKIEQELAELREKIADYTDILGDEHRVLEIVKEEALKVRDKYADDRRTEITSVEGEVDIEDLIPVEDCVMTLTKMGYIKRLPADTYRLQNRGGRGIIGMTTKEEDYAEQMFVCSSHDTILFFSNYGKIYHQKAYRVPEGSRTSKGLNIVNLLPLEAGESITAMLKVSEFKDDNYFCMVTKQGIIKRTQVSEYRTSRKGGIIAIRLNEGDELRWVKMTCGEDNIILSTKKGMAIRFNEQDARPLGRTAHGVRAIRLRSDDEVIGMTLVEDDKTILTVTETGYGRRSSFEDYRLQSRGGIGIMNYRCAKFGDVAEICTVKPDDDLMLIATDGVVIRVPVDSISLLNRPAKGVRVMKVSEGAKLITAAVTDKVEESADDEEPSENPAAPSSGAAGDTGADASENPASDAVVSESGAEEAIDQLITAADTPMDSDDGDTIGDNIDE
ncbi:MAG: DNA gyrase subunit A, partial [Acutalibacteraceae bacterium]